LHERPVVALGLEDAGDDQAAVFIAAKIREILGEHVRLASETEARVELARREELSARVMSGELDDVNLYVRRD
jgi:hypothetical protein